MFSKQRSLFLVMARAERRKRKPVKKKMLIFDSFMRTVTDRAGEREEISRYRVRQHFSDSI